GEDPLIVNLAQLRQAVRTRCGFNAHDTMHTDDSLNVAINEANWDLADEHEWPWVAATETLTCTPGTATVTPAADWSSTITIHTTENVLYRLEPVSIDELDLFADSSGRPQVFAVYGSEITLGPTPDLAYTLRHRYRRMEPELSADTDT